MIERAMLSEKDRASKLPQDLQIDTGETKKEKVRTPGWRFFDAMVYGVMQYGINIGLSLIMWWDNEFHGKDVHLKAQKERIDGMGGGLGKIWQKTLYGYRKGFKAVNDWTANNISEPASKWVVSKLPEKSFIDNKYIKTPNSKEEGFQAGLSGFITSYLLLAWGGRLLMLPNKWLEDSKPKLVRFFDKINDKMRTAMGKAPTEEELNERQKVYHKLDNELATESMANLAKARFFGELMVGAAALTPLFFDPKRLGIQRVGVGALKGLGALEKATGKQGRWSFLYPEKEGTFDPNYPPKANKLQGLAYATSIEGMATGIVATALYMKLKAKELFGNKGQSTDATTEIAEKSKSTDEKPISKETFEKEYTTLRDYTKETRDEKAWAKDDIKRTKPEQQTGDHREKRKHEKVVAEEAELAMV